MTPDDIAYLRDRASAAGYNADDILKAINYESRGREGVWGGKGGNYFGLIQFGGPERQKYHIDTTNPNARNQIDGIFGFLRDRGFKPGMGLLDLYSTINAGSPGHYNASDGNGTVAGHVAKMMGMSAALPSTAASSSSVPSAMGEAVASPAQPRPDYLASIAAIPVNQRRGGLLSPQQEQPYDDGGFSRNAAEFHAMNRDNFIKGLLQG